MKASLSISEKMVNGRIEKYYNDICLMEQPFIRIVIRPLRRYSGENRLIGENISVRRFARFEMGEGLEKKNENFAEEVAKQMK